MEDCIFCAIRDGKMPGYILDENEDTIVFLSLENHPLVVTKKHIKDIYSLDVKLGAKVTKEVVKIAKAVKRGLKCDGIYITQANEPAAGQDVFHYHVHIRPRWKKQTGQETNRYTKEITAKKIRAAL